MSWKDVIVLALVMTAISGLFLMMRGCATAVDQADKQERQDWRNFVAQHHCSVVPTRWYEANRWQCEGFQVEHY